MADQYKYDYEKKKWIKVSSSTPSRGETNRNGRNRASESGTSAKTTPAPSKPTTPSPSAPKTTPKTTSGSSSSSRTYSRGETSRNTTTSTPKYNTYSPKSNSYSYSPKNSTTGYRTKSGSASSSGTKPNTSSFSQKTPSTSPAINFFDLTGNVWDKWWSYLQNLSSKEQPERSEETEDQRMSRAYGASAAHSDLEKIGMDNIIAGKEQLEKMMYGSGPKDDFDFTMFQLGKMAQHTGLYRDDVYAGVDALNLSDEERKKWKTDADTMSDVANQTYARARAYGGDMSALDGLSGANRGEVARAGRLGAYQRTGEAMQQLLPEEQRKESTTPVDIPAGYDLERFYDERFVHLYGEHIDGTPATEQERQEAKRNLELVTGIEDVNTVTDWSKVSFEPDHLSDMQKLNRGAETYADLWNMTGSYTNEDVQRDMMTVLDYQKGHQAGTSPFVRAPEVSDDEYHRALERLYAMSGVDMSDAGNYEQNAAAITSINETMRKTAAEPLMHATGDMPEDVAPTTDDYQAYLTAYARRQADAEKAEQEAAALDQQLQDKWGSYSGGEYEPRETIGFGDYTSEDLIYELVAAGDDEKRRAEIIQRAGATGNDFALDRRFNAGYQHMTDEERGKFFDIWEKEGPKGGLEYLDDLSPKLLDLENERKEGSYKQFADEKPVLANLTGRLGTMVSAAEYIPNLISNALTGKQFSDVGARFTQAVTNKTAQNIAEATPNANLFGRNIPALLYQAATSSADSGLLALSGNPALATMVLSTSAANATLTSKLDAGVPFVNAMADSAAVGMIELITEKYSVEALMSDPTSLLGYIGKNMATEGAEEMASEVLNIGYDMLVYGDDSEVAQRFRELVVQGYTPDEAYFQVAKEKAGDVAESGIVGSVSGGMGAGPRGVTTAITDASAGKNLQKNEAAQSLLDFAGKMLPEGDVRNMASELMGAIKEGGKVANSKLGRIYRELLGYVDEHTRQVLDGTMARNVREQLREMGENSSELVDSVLRVVAGDGSASPMDYITVGANDAAHAVAKSLTDKIDYVKGVMEKAGEFVENASKKKPAPEAAAEGERVFNPDAEEGETESSSEEFDFYADEADAGIEFEGMNLSDSEVSTTSDGEEVSVDGVESVGTDGEMMFKVTTADGTQKTVSASEVSLGTADQDTARLAAYAKEYGTDAASMFNARMPSQDVKEYAAAFGKAVQYGRDGRNIDSVSGYDSVKMLNPNQLGIAYEIGRAERSMRTEMTRQHVTEKMTANGPVKVGMVDVSQIKSVRGLNKHQRRSIVAMRNVAELLGINIEFTESAADERGRYQGAHGSWNPSTLTLSLDIHAGSDYANDLNYAMMHTAGHELTHTIYQFADVEIRDAYQDFVLSALGNKMTEDKLEARIQEYIGKPGVKNRDAAIEEIVAEASVEAFSKITESDIRQLAEENYPLVKRIANQITRWVSNMKRKIAKAFAGTEAKNEYAKMMNDQLDELAEKWNAALVNAVRNKNTQQWAAERNQTEFGGERVFKADDASEATSDAAGEFDFFADVDSTVETTPTTSRRAERLAAVRARHDFFADGMEPTVDPSTGAVVAPNVAEFMRGDDYSAPDNGLLGTRYSIRETEAWAKSHREQYPDDKTFEQNLALVQQFDRDVAADAVSRYLVPHGRVPKTVRGPLRNNVEYVYTFDMDTKCERTYQFLAYRDAIQKRIGRQLKEDEARCLIELMRAYGQMIPCTYCYVEGKRMKLAELYMKYLEKNGGSVMGRSYSAEEVFDIVETARSVVAGYLDDRFNTEDNYTLDATLATGSFEGYRDFNMPITEEAAADEICKRYGVTDKAAKRVIAGFVAEWVYSRRMDVPQNLVNADVDFNSAGIDERVLAFHDLASKAAQGGAKAKGVENYEPYVDQLKNVSVEDKRYMVGMGGIRKHSSNDFQIQNVQDYMLFFMDLAADKRGGVSWTGHTYTKNLDYARIFAPTNDRINVSIAMYGDNASGIRPNTQEGVEWEELKQVRKQYKNVGAMAMVTNNDQLSFALNSDWIDMIIPFHASGMKRSLYYDVLAWMDYTSKQSERLYTKGQMIEKLRAKGIKVSSSAKAADVLKMFMENFDVKTVYNEKTGKRVAPHFFPGETEQHGVKIPGHNNDPQRYFELCEQYGTNPRFFGVKVQNAAGETIDVTQHPSYLKLIKETARTDSPQEPIVAKFDMDYVNKAMKAFKGYANLSEDPFGIVDEFVSEYAGKKRKVGELTERAQQYKEIREEMATEEAAKRASRRETMIENINAADDGQSETFDDDLDMKFSMRVTDQKTLDFLENQDTVTTYKTMQVVDGKLYPPMAAVVAGQYEDASQLGTWEQATERPDLIKLDKKGKPQFTLNKGKGKGSLAAAYNPYMHSSNLVLNDQFSGAYDRPNLVTVECEVPVSELTSGYHAQYAKDSVGWHAWHTGTVAGALRRKTGIERQVLLSRWIKPVRIIPDREVAQMYKELLGGTGIAVPDNVVPPSLLRELKNAGVEIAVSGRVSDDGVKYQARDNGSTRYMNWAIEEGLLTKGDQQIIHRTLANKDFLKYNVAKTKDGKYVIPCDTVVVFASGTYNNPVVEDVVIFNVAPRDYEKAVGHAMEVLYGEHRSYLGRISKYEAHAALEALLQDGSATVFSSPLRTTGSADGYGGRGKRTTGGRIAERSAEREGEESVELFQLRDPDRVSDRELLANMMDSAAENQVELDFVRRYRSKIAELDQKQAEYEQARQDVADARKSGARKSDIAVLENKVNILGNQLDRMDGQLLKFEAGKPLQAVVKRQREELRKKASERMQKRVAEVRRQEREKYDRLDARMEELRQKKNAKIEELKREKTQKVKEVRDEKNESFAKQKYRKRLEEDIGTLRTWVTSPTNKEHVPQFMRKPLGDMIASLDFSSVRSLSGGADTQKDQKLKDALDAMNLALMQLRSQQDGLDQGAAQFATIIDLPFGYNEEFTELVAKIKTTLDATRASNDIAINRMTSAQLKALSQAIRTLTTSIRQMNRLLANAKYESAVTAANNTMDSLDKMTAKKDAFKLTEAVGKFMDWTNTVPYYAFKRFGEGGKAIFSGLMDGWDKLAFNSDRLVKFTDAAYTTKEVKKWAGEMHSIQLDSGDTVRMTTAQLMSLYCLSKRAQAVGHLMGGGIRIADIESKGKRIVQSENYTLTQNDLRTFADTLTARQREVADKLQEFMSTQGAEWGNEISMKRFGYEMFTEAHYFPIETDSNNRRTIDEQAQENSLFRLLNMSATKGLVKGANNAIVVRDIFDVFTAHSSDMAKYNALGLQILDAMKWLNYVERTQNDDGSITTRSVQKSLERAYGTDARKYILNLLRDLNGTREGGRNDGLINKVISNAKVASVAANVRVYLLQATSMPRAAYAISPAYLSIGMAKMMANPVKAAKTAIEKVGIAKWKSMGFYDTNISGNIREMVKHDQTIPDKIREASMAPAGWFDNMTMATIYYAAEAECAKKYPNTKKGSATWDKLVNDRVRDIVYQTQVVDSTMTRSDAMRGKGIVTLATAFMSEPTLTMNMLSDAIYDARMKHRGMEDIKAPTAKMAKAIGVFTVTAVLTALMESLFDAERDDDEFETLNEKYMAALIGDLTEDDTAWQKFGKVVFSNIGSNLNVLNNIPFVSDAMSIVQGYDNSAMYSAFIDSFKSSYDAYNSWLEGKGTMYSWIYSGLKGVSQASGLPVSNAAREVTSVWNTFFAEKMGWKRIQTYPNTEREAAKAIFKAQQAGDTERVSHIRDRAGLYSMDEEKINSAIAKFAEDAYLKGDMSREAAAGIMTSDGGKRNRQAEDALVKADYQRETGLKHSDMKDDFIAGVLTEAKAREHLKKYDGLRKDDIDDRILEWKYEQKTGLSYSSMKQDYLDGELTDSEVMSYRTQYGGAEKADVEETLGHWQYEKDTGLLWSELKDDYADGVISETKLRDYLKVYGGKDEEEVEEKVSNYDFQIATGRTSTAPKYWRIAHARETGGDYRAYVDEAFQKIMYGGEKRKTQKQARSQIASSLASYYKYYYLPIAGTAEGNAMLERILDVYEAIGYSRSYERKYIAENWFE